MTGLMAPSSTSETPYLLLIESGTAARFSLPLRGTVSIGTADDCVVRLQEPLARAHELLLSMSDEGAVLEPLSQVGHAQLNGSPLTGAQSLSSGDVVRLGETTIAFHRKAGRAPGHDLLDERQWRRRLSEETERFLRYRAPFSLLIVDLGQDSADLASVSAACSKAVRLVDIVGWAAASQIAVIFPQTTASAEIPAKRVLQAIVGLAPAVRGGLVRCPADACEADSLLTGARLAAAAAKPGAVASVADAVEVLQLGDATIRVLDPAMRTLFELLRRLAASDLPVLVHGETGAGKEMVAQALHAWSPRGSKRLVAVNCAAIPESLLESELFGHERGAFSGAVQAKPGLFEQAGGGTVFLDEVGDCALLAQAKLLRVLETKKVSRVGATSERPIDARMVSATNRDLQEDIAAQRFRMDLFYRLSAATVVVTPLRDRHLDVPVLARAFLDSARERLKRPAMQISDGAMQRLLLHSWPGNVRELKNTMEFVAAAAPGEVLEAQDLPDRIAGTAAPWMVPRGAAPKPAEAVAAPAPSSSAPRNDAAAPPEPPHDPAPRKPRSFRNISEEIAELEKLRISEALEESGGVRVRAAQLIGMPLRTMLTKMKQYGMGAAGRDGNGSGERDPGSVKR